MQSPSSQICIQSFGDVFSSRSSRHLADSLGNVVRGGCRIHICHCMLLRDRYDAGILCHCMLLRDRYDAGILCHCMLLRDRYDAGILCHCMLLRDRYDAGIRASDEYCNLGPDEKSIISHFHVVDIDIYYLNEGQD